MIRSHEQFEAALEEASRLLDPPPQDGTADHARLLALMAEIAAYRPAIRVDTPAAEPETAKLSRRLDAFEASLAPHLAAHWHTMLGGDFSAPADGRGAGS